VLRDKSSSIQFKTALFFLCLVLAAAGPAYGMAPKPPDPPYAPGELMVGFYEDTSPERIARIVQEEGGEIRSVLKRTGVHLIVLPEGTDVMDAAARFSAHPEVRYAEPNYRPTPLEKQ
jgi:hypothetical protein